jgi:transposase-like protein
MAARARLLFPAPRVPSATGPFMNRKWQPFRLTEAFLISEEDASAYLKSVYWPGGNPQCPNCGSVDCAALRAYGTKSGRFQCRSCRRIFSLHGCTPFKGSHLPFATWVAAIRLWFCFGDDLYPQYVKETLSISTHKTAKRVLDTVQLLMGDEVNRERFWWQNAGPNYSPMARFTEEYRKKKRSEYRQKEAKETSSRTFVKRSAASA